MDRETRDRVLVLRFLMTLPMPSFGSTAAGTSDLDLIRPQLEPVVSGALEVCVLQSLADFSMSDMCALRVEQRRRRGVADPPPASSSTASGSACRRQPSSSTVSGPI